MFYGFKPETFAYLDQLGLNNSRGWFEAHKNEYIDYLKRPFMELVEDLAPTIHEIDPALDTDPKRCIARINRDIRFTTDKSPYRTNLWLAFKRNVPDWKEEPAFFFEIFPDHYRYGMGFFITPRPVIELIRTAVSGREKTFMDLHRQYLSQELYVLAGEKYKKIITPDIPVDLMEWNQRKEFYFMADHPVDETLMGPELINILSRDFKKLNAWYQYFRNLTEIGQISDGKLR